MRPVSIVNFERLYLASLAVWIVDKLAFWSVTQEAVLRNPQIMANPQLAGMIAPIALGITALYAVVSVVLWYVVARRASVAGKWIVVVTEAIGALFALGTVARLIQGTTISIGDSVMGLIATALAIAAAVTLFRPDAKAWFGESATDVGPLA